MSALRSLPSGGSSVNLRTPALRKQTWGSEAEEDRGRKEENALQLGFLPAFVEGWWGQWFLGEQPFSKFRLTGYLCAQPSTIGWNCLPVQARSKAELDSVAPQ